MSTLKNNLRSLGVQNQVPIFQDENKNQVIIGGYEVLSSSQQQVRSQKNQNLPEIGSNDLQPQQEKQKLFHIPPVSDKDQPDSGSQKIWENSQGYGFKQFLIQISDWNEGGDPEIEIRQTHQYLSQLEQLHEQQKFIELSENDLKKNQRDLKKILEKFKVVIEKQKERQELMIEDHEKIDEITEDIQDGVNEIKQKLTGIKNKDLKDYLQEILLEAVKEENLQDHFIGLFEIDNDNQKAHSPQPQSRGLNNLNNIDNSQILRDSVQAQNIVVLKNSDLSPIEFEKEFQAGLRSKSSPQELITKNKKYIKDPKYFKQLDMEQMIKEIYVETSQETLDLINKINIQLSQYLKYPNKQKETVSSLSNDFKQLFEQQMNSNSLHQLNESPLEIYNIMFHLAQAVIPDFIVQLPKTLKEQQIQDLEKIINKLPRLPNTYTIMDYKTIDGNQDIEEKMDKFLKDYESDQPIRDEKLLMILFDLIKKQQNFKDLLTKISLVNSQDKLTQLILLIYLLEHADDELQVLLCIDCTQFIPIPLSYYNPWSKIKEKNQKINHEQKIGDLQAQELQCQNQSYKLNQILDKIYYVYEKSKAILQFKIPKSEKSFVVESKIKGCSFLLNKIFGREFSENDNNLTNYGQVEIQFDYDCANIEHLVIADSHGFIDQDVLKNISPLFDGFIIHIDQESNKKQLDNFLKQISSINNGQKTILIINHNSLVESLQVDKHNQMQFNNLKVLNIRIPNLRSLQGNLQNQLLNLLHNGLDEFFNIQIKDYKKDVKRRLQSKQSFLDILKVTNQELIPIFEDAHKRQSEILNEITNEKNLRGQKFLPMMNLLQQKKIIEEKLQNENCSDADKIDGQQQLKQTEQKIKSQEPSLITKYFSETINKNQCMKLLPFLSSVIKDYLEDKNKALLEQREKIREELHIFQQQEDKEQSASAEEQLKEFNKKIENNWFSIEMVFREILYLGQYSEKSSIVKSDFNNLIKHFDSSAQPLQKIDGDSLNIFSKSYEEVLKKNEVDNEELLVISVIGPQSSGKSLLLNKIFGTSFLSASGRCTKGVYFSIIRYNLEGKIKKILILDSEGIQSAEARDRVFDKRIIYFAIGVSHIVLICNKQEINAQMSDTIKLVAEAIAETKAAIVKNPAIYIVLNMCPDVDDTVILQGANQIKYDLLEMSSKKNQLKDENERDFTNSMIQIDQKNIIKFGFAFNKAPFGPKNKRAVNKPNEDFAIRAYKLSQIFKNYFQQIKDGKTTKFTISEWLEHAYDFWIFSNSCRILKDYLNLHQKYIDAKLTKYIQDKIKQNYSEEIWINKHKPEVIKECDKNIEKHKNGNEVKIDEVLFKQIDQFIKNLLQIDESLLQEYYDFCIQENIEKELMDKRLLIFYKAKDQAISRAVTFYQVYLQNFVGEKTRLVGDTLVKELAQNYLKDNKIYTEIQAKKLFQEVWKEVREKVKKLLKKDDQIALESIQSVIFQFNNHLFQTLEGNENDLFDLARVTPENQWLEKIQLQFYEGALMYSGDYYGLPKIDKILKYQNQSKKYIDNQQVQLFQSQTIFIKFKWWLLFETIFNCDKLVNDIQGLCDSIIDPNYIAKQIKNTFGIQDQKKLEIILRQFKKECKKLGFYCLLDQDKLLEQIITLRNNNRSKKMSDYCKVILKKLENFDCYDDLDLFRQSRWVELEDQFVYFYNIKNVNSKKFIQQASQKQDGYNNEKIIESNQEIEISPAIKQKIMYGWPGNFSFNRNHFETHLRFMINASTKNTIDNHKAAARFFFRTVKWNLIFQDIQQIIIARFHKDQQVIEQNSIEKFNKSLDQNEKKITELGQIDNEHARDIIKEVRDLIEKVNTELKPFCMKISQRGETFILLVTQIYTEQLTEKLETLRQNEVLRTFEKTKENQEEWFIAKLTANDSKIDETNVKNAAEEIDQFFKNQCNKEAKEYFKQEMDAKRNTFEREYYLRDLNKNCIEYSKALEYKHVIKSEFKQSKEDLIEFLMDPKEKLQKQFTKKFDLVKNKFIKESNQFLLKNYKERKDGLIQYLQIIAKETKHLTNSDEVFLIDQEQQKQFIQQNDKRLNKEFIKFQKLAAANYLRLLINDQWNNQSENIVKDWKFKAKDYLPLSATIKDQVKNLMSKETFNKFNSIISKIQEINNIQLFINFFITSLQKLNSPKELESGEIIDTTMHEYRRIFIGCYYVCPMCRKQCDEIHEPNIDVKHNFDKGSCHQFQGFGGNKAKGSNKAITFCCNDLKDDVLVNYENNLKKWLDLKNNQLKDWNFQQKQEDVKALRPNQVRIWNLVGQDLCARYNKEKNLEIIFEQAKDKMKMIQGKVHFILALDCSGSMTDQPWDDLKKSVSEFIQKLEQNQELKQNSKITCILFSDNAQVVFNQQLPSQNLLNKIQMFGTYTNFDDPLAKAYDIFEKTEKDYDRTVLYFMTDGHPEPWKIPDDEIQKFKKHPEFKEQLTFYAVGFGANFHKDLLKYIAYHMNGELIDAPTARDLSNSFLQIISNVYKNRHTFL